MNVLISFIVPPILAIIVAGILHISNDKDTYTLYNNGHLKTFLFLSVIIIIFLSITNSVEDIIKDRNVLFRERKLNIGVMPYFASKLLTLMVFSLLQNLLFISLSFFIFQIKELYWFYFLFFNLISFVGISTGLFISSIKKVSIKAVTNLVPLVLIPQIIFAGAMIYYEKMNKSLTLIKKNPIPEVCQLIPSRWAYEALIVMQGSENSYNKVADSLFRQKNNYNSIIQSREMFNANLMLFNNDTAKAYAKLSADSASCCRAYYHHDSLYKLSYGNVDIEDMLRGVATTSQPKWLCEPLLTKVKEIPFSKIKIATPLFNACVLLIYALLLNVLTLINLKRNYFS